MIDTKQVMADYRAMRPVDIQALCDEIDRLRGEKQQGKTVNAKVRVAVDVNGEIATDEEYFKYLNEPVHVYTLTADLLVPEEIEVKAKVCDE